MAASSVRRHLGVLPALAALCGCTALPAGKPESAYRALGTEPFWSVTINGGRIVYQPADGAPIAVTAPVPRTTFNGHRYETPTLIVDVTHARCSDGMSDNVYADTVLVIADGRELRGCGGAVTGPEGA